MNGQSHLERHLKGYESATTVMSSELETTSFCDSDDDDTMSRSEKHTDPQEKSKSIIVFHKLFTSHMIY